MDFDVRRHPVLATLVVAIGIYVACSLNFRGFASVSVAANLLSENAYLGVIGIGLTFVILTGGIDLSVGALAGASGIALARLVQDAHWSPWPAVAAILLGGISLGLVQGTLVARYRLAPFLVTLSGLFFCRGLALYISKEARGIDHPVFKSWTDFAVRLPEGARLPVGAWVFVAALVVGGFVLARLPFGRSVYAVGGSASSAHLMGVPVVRTTISVYAISGFCAALAGILYSIALGSGNPIAGVGMELDAIAAVVIGGTLLTGGYGSVWGTLLGVLILGMIQTAITFQGTLNSWWTKIAVGILLLGFILAQKAIGVRASSGPSA